ncbi:SMC-Scp complex subunit ScpB [Bombilactobacillus thymidiniphilus]|uniref:Segregation and condensation protein B n=1 Tax=Bombilactobacillus thymidiniphilus TaxID=2923363 RepID=A0ABY4PDG9_9LACO|nr:SMC-Scp complex subunit ScpB [Bombilactobacillus thymidiniphilus]UQS83723.1 SMC-Scp complex subunit ScpB [Bombilactobacillus thymidiniphilus]
MLKSQIEALLYVAGDQGIDLQTLAQLLQIKPTAVRQQLAQIKAILDENEQIPVTLKQFGSVYKLLTKKQYHSLIKNFFQTEQVVNLSQAALEVLAVIAYQQPVTRIEIDEIRGVKSSSSSLQTLVTRQMIKITGHKDAPGHPLMYATTEQFLDYFGLTSLDELPDLQEFQEQNLDRQGNVDLFS